jgi:2-oxoglutarate ferredoxin oxidoreductase subunit gamma
MANIICAGFGGQGVLTAGLILARTGMEYGKEVTWIPSYGSEMRGGTANCNVKISESKIASPFIKRIDILIAMNIPSMAKFEKMIVPGGLVISNKTIINNWCFRKDINVIEVGATVIADEIKNIKGANIVMLGALAASGELYTKEEMGSGIESFFAMKGKNNPKNSECFIRGFEDAEKNFCER